MTVRQPLEDRSVLVRRTTLPAMTWLIRLVLCLPLLVAGCGSSVSGGGSTSTATDDTGAVHKAFETYAKAALAKDGTTAQSVLADTVSAYYDDARKLALTAGDDQLAGVPTVDAMVDGILVSKYGPGKAAALHRPVVG